jgi:hypothetical protein
VAAENNWSGAASTGRVAYIDIRDLSEAAALGSAIPRCTARPKPRSSQGRHLIAQSKLGTLTTKSNWRCSRAPLSTVTIRIPDAS